MVFYVILLLVMYMSKLSNTITMLTLLNSGRKYSVKELADILEVSERMIRIYKEDLEKSGIYIDTIMGPYGGYVLNQSIRLPVRKFKSSDVLVLDKYIELEADEVLRNKLIILQDKVRGVYIGSKLEEKELDLTNETQKKYNILMRAIKDKRKVFIRYYSFNKGENDRVICPVDLFLFYDGWYCAAFCEVKQDIRHFELKRMINYKLLDDKYE